MAQINLDTLPRSRKEARELGSKLYYTGKPCKHGHLEPRKTCDGKCRSCARRGYQAWAEKNDRSQYNAAYQQANRETLSQYRLAWYHENGGDQGRAARRRDPARHAAMRSAWRKSNRDKIRSYERQAFQENDGYRLGKLMRNRITAALRCELAGKSTPTASLVNCSWSDLKAHLESQFQPGMTWDNYGIYGWHIDHIIPCASFDLTDPEQQKACFHYTNLQPLWAEENLKKGARLVA